ncbi:MAG: two-component regulator propeller domain-containing protein, partial [Pseudomonadota bacterium]
MTGLWAWPGSVLSSNNPAVRMLGVADGLPDHHVEALVQDRDGFVWIATRNGLVRHEGQRLRMMRVDATDPLALPGANVQTLAAASNGHVWAAIEGYGLVEIDRRMRVVRQLKPQAQQGRLLDADIWALAEGCDDTLWIAFSNGGLARYWTSTDSLQLIPQTEAHGLIERAYQMDVLVDAFCNVWALQSHRLAVLEEGAGTRFQPVLDRQAGEPLMMSIRAIPDRAIGLFQGESITSIRRADDGWRIEPLVDAPGVVVDGVQHADGWWSLSTFAGLLRWHPDTGQQALIDASPGTYDGLPNNELFHLLLDQDGGLWVSVARSGVAYLSPDVWAFDRFRRAAGGQGSLPMQAVYALLPDEEPDHLWIAGRTEGLHRLNLEDGHVQSAGAVFDRAVLDRFERINRLSRVGSELIIAWTSQVDAFDTESRQFRQLFDSPGLANGTVRRIESDHQDELWLGLYEGDLLRYQRSSGQLERFSPSDQSLGQPNCAGITGITRDP